MTTHELYINDVLMDLEKDANIYLNYQSPLFTDLQSIVSNRSNSVSLPLTPNNIRAIDFYHLADKSDPKDGTNAFPRRWHAVRYYRNGVRICEYGRGMITAIEDNEVKFAFYWGNIDNFQFIFDKYLHELSTKATVSWGTSSSHVGSENSSYGFYKMQCCANRSETSFEYLHPCVSTDYLIRMIMADSGLNIRTKVGDKRKIENYLIPCLTKHSFYKDVPDLMKISSEDIQSAGGRYENKYHTISPRGNLVVSDENGNIYNEDGKYFFPTSDPLRIWHAESEKFHVSNYTHLKVHIAPFTVVYIHSTGNPGVEDTELSKGEVKADNNFIRIRIGENTVIDTENITDNAGPGHLRTFTYIFDETNVTIPIEALSDQESTNDPGNPEDLFIAINLSKNGTGTVTYRENGELVTIPNFTIAFDPGANQAAVTVIPLAKECKFSGENNVRFPLALNLPEIRQSDFLKCLMQMNGVFAHAKDPNVIDLISVDDIIANLPNALDWSDKLDNRSFNFSVPESIDFRLSGFSQKNICKYENDDDIVAPSEYCLVVNDQTLDRDPNELVTLPFSETLQNSENRAYIPIYEIKKDAAAAYEYNEDCAPRILRVQKENNGICKATFEGLKWDGLQKNYKGYQSVIKNPRVLKVKCRLSDYDLSALDFTMPVTFRQFGNYYIVLSVKSSSKGLSDCELLEIK